MNKITPNYIISEFTPNSTPSHLLHNTKEENSKKPISEQFQINYFNYLENNKTDKFVKILYQDPVTKGPSTEFKLNLVYYYLFLFTYLLILTGFYLLIFYNSQISFVHLTIHLIFIGIFLLLSVVLLMFTFKSESVLMKNRNYFLALNLLISFYLIFTDERILSNFTNESLVNTYQPLPIGLICIILITRQILFDYYFYTFLLTGSILLIFLTTHLAMNPTSIYSILSEISIIFVFGVLQIADCHRVNFRIKEIYNRRELENSQEKHKLEKVNLYGLNGINSEAENLLVKCDLISSNLRSISKVVIYKDIKRLLKNSLGDVEKIKLKIAHGGIEISRIELNSALDDDDRMFITENFMSPTSVRGSFIQPTFTEISEKNESFPLFKYGKTEIEKELSGLGKNWDFNIFLVSEKTGHTITMIAAYLLQKWNIQELSGLKQETASYYFQELENVRKT